MIAIDQFKANNSTYQQSLANNGREIKLKNLEFLGQCLQCDVKSVHCNLKHSYWLDFQKLQCNMCPLGCKNCVYSNQIEKPICQSCYTDYQLDSGQCFKIQQCQSGNYFDEYQSKCVKCMDYCKQCHTKSQCKQCEDGYVLENGLCKSRCKTGFKWSENNQCEEICGDGLLFKKSGCDDGNNLNGDGCNSNCEVEENYECVRETEYTPDKCYIKKSKQVNQRQLYVNFDNMFRLISNQENQITVEIIQKVAMYGKMNEILNVYIPNCDYSFDIQYEEFTYITYTFYFPQLVPPTQMVFFNITIPNKIFPLPQNLEGLALVIQTRNTYSVPDQSFQNLFIDIISYFLYISQIVFLISTFLLNTKSFQSLVLWASLNLKAFIDKIHASWLSFNINQPAKSLDNIRNLEGNERLLADVGDIFNPTNFSSLKGHLDYFMGFYIILGAVLLFNIIFGIIASIKKSEKFSYEFKKRFVFNYYLAVIFLFYETYSEDVIYRIYKQIFLDLKEEIICYLSAAFIVLHPFYILPILIKSDKEQEVEILGEMIFISADNRIRIIDISISIAALVQTIILAAVSQQSYIFQESVRSQVANVIIYLPFLPIFIFLVYYIQLIIEKSRLYLREREQMKKIIPIDVFIQQTRTYTMSKKILNQIDSEEKLPKSEFNSIKSRASLAVQQFDYSDGQTSFNQKQTKVRSSLGQINPAKSTPNASRFSLQNTLFAPTRKTKKETSIAPIFENKAYENESSIQESQEQTQNIIQTNLNLQKQAKLKSQNPSQVNSLQQFINFNTFEGKKNLLSNSPINATEQRKSNAGLQRQSIQVRKTINSLSNQQNLDPSPSSSNYNLKTTPYISIKTKPTEFSEQVEQFVL
ncbi:proprotein convertase-like protein (macronuclear) [Tetrahymena thermophila SB210]|uniref:Proprotein convertase-like protein n=1 Tax=Tetrahymena thermophila (strain SB210) TaxID=312017 RepID=Q22UD2_TETTS|nr:proprotein convertase-like protein [Tetrahymena thermophila SB210]EAR88755.3 proprotein convertase-like protein [Tetrahymena thermophila SB210]|eukprot:XP_001009000.3 proprotein convertase-like protein [Tetrahymena thermophila SB210]